MKRIVSTIIGLLFLSIPILANQKIPHYSNHGFELHLKKESCVKSTIISKNDVKKDFSDNYCKTKNVVSSKKKKTKSVEKNIEKEVVEIPLQNVEKTKKIHKTPFKVKEKQSDVSDVIIACAIVLGVLALIAGMIFWGIYLYNLWWYI